MKFGIVVYDNTDNVGDDILSYAASRLLPRVDYYIEREEMDLFCPETREKVAVIMNGWFLHHKYSWPPSEYIAPLLIGMHLASNDCLGIGYDYIEGRGKDFFMKAQPVGCRDSSTRNRLNDFGIEAYFSGCLTLTLNSFGNVTKRKGICIVDVPKEVEKKITEEYSADFTILTHYLSEEERKLPRKDKMKRVEKFLKRYQEATCVVTSRLHVALPCLALLTPVLLIYDKGEVDRFSDYLPLLHYCTKEELLEGNNDYNILNPPANKENYLELRATLWNTCREFIHAVSVNSKTWDKVPDNRDFMELWANKAKWQKHLLGKGWERKDSQQAKARQWILKQEEAIRWLEQQIQLKDDKIHTLERENLDLQEWIKERNASIEFLTGEAKTHVKYIAILNNKLKEITGSRLVKLLLKLRGIKV